MVSTAQRAHLLFDSAAGATAIKKVEEEGRGGGWNRRSVNVGALDIGGVGAVMIARVSSIVGIVAK